MSERSNFDYDPRLPEIEAEFFAAADLYEAYNAALLQRIDDEVVSSQDWGAPPTPVEIEHWVGVAATAAAVVAVVSLVAFAWTRFASRDLAGYDREQLDEVSPYLSRGMRNGHGVGTAFVGRIRDGFSALTPADRMLVATDLVGALREQGVNEIMVYDDRGGLQIQAFGDGPPRVVASDASTRAPGEARNGTLQESPPAPAGP